jgi:hypothetical protein
MRKKITIINKKKKKGRKKTKQSKGDGINESKKI